MSTASTQAFPAPGMVSAVAAMRHTLRELRSGTLDTSGFKPFPEDLDDSALDDGQAEVRRQAWYNSLRLARHGDYAHWTLDRLAEKEQHRERFQHYVTALSWAVKKSVQPTKLNGIAYGNVGSGKTSAIIAAGRYAMESGLRTRYLKHSDYLDWLRPNRAPAGLTEKDVVELYTTGKTELLVLDEVCSSMDNPSDWARTQSEYLVDARRAAGLPILCATNLTSRRIVEIIGSRFYSRLAGGASLFEIIGEDRRFPVSWGDKPDEAAPAWG